MPLNFFVRWCTVFFPLEYIIAWPPRDSDLHSFCLFLGNGDDYTTFPGWSRWGRMEEGGTEGEYGKLELKPCWWNHLGLFGPAPTGRQVAEFLYRLIMPNAEIRRCSYDRAWKHVLCLQSICEHYLLESVPGLPATLNFRNQSHHKRKLTLSSTSWIDCPSNHFRGTAHLLVLKMKCFIAQSSFGY